MVMEGDRALLGHVERQTPSFSLLSPPGLYDSYMQPSSKCSCPWPAISLPATQNVSAPFTREPRSVEVRLLHCQEKLEVGRTSPGELQARPEANSLMGLR